MIEKVKNFIKGKLDEISLLDIGDNRPYDFYLVFGQKNENQSPWLNSNWKKDFEPYLNKLIKQTKENSKTGIRVNKYKPEKRISKKDKKAFIYHSKIKTGRLNWNIKSHNKWTIDSNTENYFQDIEICNPRWTICNKRNSPPDIFITIYNEQGFENKRDLEFGYFMVISIAKNLKINSKPVLKEMSEKINSKATVLKTRKWGKPEKSGNWTFNNWIQDTFSNGIYKQGNLHSVEFNNIEFEPVWEVIHKEE